MTHSVSKQTAVRRVGRRQRSFGRQFSAAAQQLLVAATLEESRVRFWLLAGVSTSRFRIRIISCSAGDAFAPPCTEEVHF